MKRIIYIDDALVFLDVVKTYFEIDGEYEVTTTRSITRAESILKNGSFDIMISGHSSETDGVQLLTNLRERGESIPFIIFSNWQTEKIFLKPMTMFPPNAVVYKTYYGLQLNLLRKAIMALLEIPQTQFHYAVEMPLFLKPAPHSCYHMKGNGRVGEKTDSSSTHDVQETTNMG